MFLWIVGAHGNCKQVAGVTEIERVSRTSEYICYIHAETFIVVLFLTVFFKNCKMTLPLQDVNFSKIITILRI